MAWARILAAITRAGPAAAKQLPKLWPLLLESRNRERLGEFLVDLANASPVRRLRARIELTAALADEIARTAESPEERRRAQDWHRRARNLARRQNVPVGGSRTRLEHHRKIKADLDELQQEMDAHLGTTD